MAEDRLKKIIADQLSVSEDDVVPEASFIDDLNADSHDHSYEHKRNRLVPNFRPHVNAWSKPLRDRLVITQSRDEAQHPACKIQHTMNEAASIPIEHAQQDHDHEQDIYRVKAHGDLKITYRSNWL